MQRRSFIKASVALAASPLVSAHGLGSVAAQDMSGKIVLWHGWSGAEVETLDGPILDAWKAAMPGVEVEALYVPFDQLKNKFSIDAATGGGPDLLVGPLDWVGELATGELIAPLDEMATAEVLGSYIPAVVDALRVNGVLYGIPESFETVALYYNKEFVPTAPTTTDEVYAMAEAMTDGVYGLALYSNFYHPAGYLFGFGGQLFDADNKSIINSPETVEFLTWIQNFTTKPGLYQQNDDAGISSLFKEKKAAMVINGPWAQGDYVAAIGEENVGVAPLPLISEKGDAVPMPFLGVKHIMMSANAEGDQAAMAFEFMKFFTGPESAGLLADNAGHLPANTAVDISDHPNSVAFIKQGENVTPMPSIPEMGQVWEPAGLMITGVLSGDSTPEEAAANAQDTINSAIENME